MALRIVSSGTDYEFDFVVVAPVSNSKIQPSLAIPLPNTESKNQLLFRFAGQQEEVQFDFVLINTGDDLSNGTAPAARFPSGVVTVRDQHIYVRDYVFAAGFNVGWFLHFSPMYDDFITGNIENLTFDAPVGSQSRFRTGRFTFRRGRTTGTGTN